MPTKKNITEFKSLHEEQVRLNFTLQSTQFSVEQTVDDKRKIISFTTHFFHVSLNHRFYVTHRIHEKHIVCSDLYSVPNCTTWNMQIHSKTMEIQSSLAVAAVYHLFLPRNFRKKLFQLSEKSHKLVTFKRQFISWHQM